MNLGRRTSFLVLSLARRDPWRVFNCRRRRYDWRLWSRGGAAETNLGSVISFRRFGSANLRIIVRCQSLAWRVALLCVRVFCSTVSHRLCCPLYGQSGQSVCLSVCMIILRLGRHRGWEHRRRFRQFLSRDAELEIRMAQAHAWCW